MGTTLIGRVTIFADEFPNETTEETMLKRLQKVLNHIVDFYKELAKDCAVLYDRLKKKPPAWTTTHT